MERKRVLYYDLLNICACFSVICLHCNGSSYSFTPSFKWAQALAVEVICYWAVPVFFMLSGATLMGYRDKYDTVTFFKRRVTRVFIPFVIWTLINIVFKQAIGLIDLSLMGKRELIDKCVNTSIEGIYWFFIPLFGAYLCIPLLSLLKEHKKVLWYAVIVSFAIQGVGPYIFKWLGLTYNYGLSIPVASGYILYVLLGYLLSVTDFTQKQRYLIYLLGIGSAIFRYVSTYILSYRKGETDTTYYSYHGFFAVFLAMAVFVLFKNIPWGKLFKSDKAAKTITSISSCSFGIYLLHMIIY